MNRTEAVLERAVGIATRSECPQKVIDMLHLELAAIESDREHLSEPITEEWLESIGFRQDDKFGLTFKFLAIRIRSSGECDSWIVNTLGESATYLSTAIKTRGDVISLLAALKTPAKDQ